MAATAPTPITGTDAKTLRMLTGEIPPPEELAELSALPNEVLFPLGAKALRDIADDILVLAEIRNRFYAAKGKPLLGYISWKAFCEKHSKYSARTIQNRLAKVNGKDASKVNVVPGNKYTRTPAETPVASAPLTDEMIARKLGYTGADEIAKYVAVSAEYRDAVAASNAAPVGYIGHIPQERDITMFNWNRAPKARPHLTRFIADLNSLGHGVVDECVSDGLARLTLKRVEGAIKTLEVIAEKLKSKRQQFKTKAAAGK